MTHSDIIDNSIWSLINVLTSNIMYDDYKLSNSDHVIG